VNKNKPYDRGPVRFLATVLLVLCAIGAQHAEARVDVWLQPQTQQIAVAQTCTLEVFVASTNGDSLACMECFVAFDATLLTLISIEEGTLFENSGYQTLFFPEIVAPDTAKAVDCVLNNRSYFLPPGDLVRFVFRGDQEGVAAVQITSITIWDIDRVLDEPLPILLDPNAWITIGNPTGVEDSPPRARPLACYPNPFNPATTIELRLPGEEQNDVSLSVYSPSGRLVTTLFTGVLADQGGRFVWDGRDARGGRVASGVYFVVARTASATYTTKLVLIE
jgi:hypothetical protein